MLISSSSASCIRASRFARSVSVLIAAILALYSSHAGAASLDGPCAAEPASAVVDSSALVSAEDSAVVSAGAAGDSVVFPLDPHPARVLTTNEAARANAKYFFFINYYLP